MRFIKYVSTTAALFLLALWLVTAFVWSLGKAPNGETFMYALLIPMFYGPLGIPAVAFLSRTLFRNNRVWSALAYGAIGFAVTAYLIAGVTFHFGDAGTGLWLMLAVSLFLSAAARDLTLLAFKA